MCDGLQAVETLFSAGVRRTQFLRSVWLPSLDLSLHSFIFTSREFRKASFPVDSGSETCVTKVSVSPVMILTIPSQRLLRGFSGYRGVAAIQKLSMIKHLLCVYLKYTGQVSVFWLISNLRAGMHVILPLLSVYPYTKRRNVRSFSCIRINRFYDTIQSHC